MSNDLISRSALAKEAKEWLNCCGECCHCRYGDRNCFCKDVILKQPTAYDVDNVVERIDNEVVGITNMQLLKIDEIIKAGGIIDNH